MNEEGDVINSLVWEKPARLAYELKKAHEDVWVESDWRRPARGKPGDKWTSEMRWISASATT